MLAIGASKVTQYLPVPAPAVFLLAAATVGTLAPHGKVSFVAVERLGIVALIVILFDGGMQVGFRQMRAAAWPVAALGVLGTFATAALMAVFAHVVVGFGWTASWLLGAAVAPTDPAVMFSVLGNRDVRGRSDVILKGEAGANDPVGIALVVALVDFATSASGSAWFVVEEFVVQMAVGLAIGAIGGRALLVLMRRVTLPGTGLYPLRALAAAAVIYGTATVAHGSGFLAVFVAGLLVGDARTPYKSEVERFHDALASLAEIVVFVALGLTIDLEAIWNRGLLWNGLALGALLAFVARPLATWPLLAPARLRWGERAFVVWGGLRGAVPILLAAVAIVGGVAEGQRIYDLVFVVVAFSVLVQGSTMPLAARAFGVRMRTIAPEPYELAIGLRHEPRGVQRMRVSPGSRVAGRPIRELPIGDDSWVSLVMRDGSPVAARGSTVLEPEDEVVVLTSPDARPALRRLFESDRRAGPA